MTPKFPAASKLAVLLAATAVVAVGFGIDLGAARSRPKRDNMTDRRPPYLRPERSQPGLSAGPAYPGLRHHPLLARCRHRGAARRPQIPGLRVPAGVGYPSFARENNNRPIDRQPLNPPSDMGGYPRSFPLY